MFALLMMLNVLSSAEKAKSLGCATALRISFVDSSSVSPRGRIFTTARSAHVVVVEHVEPTHWP